MLENEDQLQDVDYVEPVEDEIQDELPTDTEADLAPASESEGTEDDLKLPPEVQKKVEKRIGKATFQWREAERKAERLEAELRQIKSQQEAKPVPVVPDIPDPFDPDYEQKVAARDEAVRARAQHDAEQARIAQQEHAAQQQRIEADRQRFNEAVENYTKRAVALGIAPQELQFAGQGVAAYLGHMPDIAEEIVNDERGPLITVYLAENIAELEKIASMSPVKAARYIESIQKRLTARTSKISKTPEPVQKLSGNAPQGNAYFKHSKGATFE